MATYKKKIISNVLEWRKDYLVHVTLKNGEIYDVIFQCDPETNVMTQEKIFQKQWDEKNWTYIPKLVHETRMYLNTGTHELELVYDYFPHGIPQKCILMTYDMFEEVSHN